MGDVLIIVRSRATLLQSLPAGAYTGFADYLTTISTRGPKTTPT